MEIVQEIDPTFRLMFLMNEGDLQGIQELLDAGTYANLKDIDRTVLHVAALQGKAEVVELLLKQDAIIDVNDHWGSTMAPVHVQDIGEVPEYEIDPKELDFTNSEEITKGTFRLCLWRGIKVAVKTPDGVF